jgi:hypothetical protein
MSRPTVVISVYGGVVQDVFCSEPRAVATVVDWDAEGTDSSSAGYVSVYDNFGHESPAIVSRCQAEPLSAMKNTPIKAALKRAEFLSGRL